MYAACVQSLRPHPFQLDLGSLRPIVRVSRLLEPGVLKSLLGRDTLRRIVDEDLLEKILEVFQKWRIARDDVLLQCQQCIIRQQKPPKLLVLLTSSFFIAFTNLREALVVSGCG